MNRWRYRRAPRRRVMTAKGAELPMLEIQLGRALEQVLPELVEMTLQPAMTRRAPVSLAGKA